MERAALWATNSTERGPARATRPARGSPTGRTSSPANSWCTSTTASANTWASTRSCSTASCRKCWRSSTPRRRKLYVPVSQTHLLSRYVGVGRRQARAARARRQALDCSEKVAAEQRRAATSPRSCSRPRRGATRSTATPSRRTPPWQHEFEAGLPVSRRPPTSTGPSPTSSATWKAARPMDRLICGDVGYGKTEVAMRAAFKAVMDGKQVAVLVPDHRPRPAALRHVPRAHGGAIPSRVEMLSRFRTRAEQAAVVRRVGEGDGGHRRSARTACCSATCSSRDLGLVIIDEEQRFGVAHKEHLKQPARAGGRADADRHADPAHALHEPDRRARHEHDPDPAAGAPADRDHRRAEHRRDRARGDPARAEPRRPGLLPAQPRPDHPRACASASQQLRARGAHRRRPRPDARERRWRTSCTAFVRGEFDVLLCTTIIESGVDIPNVNTILIDRADRFGMADLYQLRGRVGRYKHQAYAYLLLPRHGRCSTRARERIGAIKRYSSLGAGFKLALRDLEIRGAGNLLGAAAERPHRGGRLRPLLPAAQPHRRAAEGRGRAADHRRRGEAGLPRPLDGRRGARQSRPSSPPPTSRTRACASPVPQDRLRRDRGRDRPPARGVARPLRPRAGAARPPAEDRAAAHRRRRHGHPLHRGSATTRS